MEQICIRPAVPHRLVRVQWGEGARVMPATPEREAVGYLIVETREEITVAPSLEEAGTEHLRACGIVRIPRAGVQHMAYC